MTSPAYPTAEHDVMLKQSTPCRKLFTVETLGLGTIDQAEPFHCSTSDWYPVPGDEALPDRRAPGGADARDAGEIDDALAGGVRVDTMDQAVPFHCSARLSFPSSALPTATHIVEVVQETALKKGPLPRPVVGVVWSVQVVPFQLAASGA